LDRALASGLPLLPNQQDRSWLCYYLSQVCNFVRTDFTPMPDDFPRWCRQAPGDAYADPIVAGILDMLDSGQPFNFVQHQRITAGAESAGLR
jgi:hypothetical protein